MMYEQKQHLGGLGRVSGYVAAYLLFTTVLFFMLTLMEKLPESWSYPHIIVLTAAISLLGVGVKRFLK